MRINIVVVALLMHGLSIQVAQAQVLKIATLAPDGTRWMQEMRRGAKEIEQRTQQRVSFKFYPGGIMGNEKTVYRKMQIGQIHAAAFTTGGLALIYPENQIYSQPLIFNDYEEVDYVRARMDKQIVSGLEQRGYTPFGLSEGGFAYLMSKDAPIRRVSDLKQQKVWIPEGDIIAQVLLEQFDIKPVALPLTDVMTGLQTGLITTVGATPSFAIALQWHTKVKYLTDAPLFYSYGALVMSNKYFKKISSKDRVIVREVLEGVFAKLNQMTRSDNESAKIALRQHGMEVIVPAQQDLNELRDYGNKAIEVLSHRGVFDNKMLQQVEQHLDNFRANPGRKATTP